MSIINQPISKITASASILGTLAASFYMFSTAVDIPEAGYGLIGAIISGATVFLFTPSKHDDDAE